MIDQLVKISRYYGQKKGFALGGGGNTSLKNDEHLWVKASGYSLGEITEDGFAILNRGLLKSISEKEYSRDPFERERQVKDDLMAANVYPDRIRRPSVEASLHDLIDHTFVVHTHPYVVNALMCSKKAKEMTLKIFGPEALFVPYIDPGYILFKRIERDLVKYRRKYKRHPNIIFLQNHGVFIAAGTINEIKDLYTDVFRKLKKYFKKEADIHSRSYRFDNISIIKKSFLAIQPGIKHVFKTRESGLINYFTASAKRKALIEKPFIPDQIVYCKTNPLWIARTDQKDPEKIEKSIAAYHKKYGYLPRIILIEKGGMIGIEINDQSAKLVLDVFEDAMKISFYSLNFGGPHFMNPRQIKFIESWEVENYRRNLLVNK